MASKWWAAETWGTHSQQGTVTADRISELLMKLRQENLTEGRKWPLCRLQMEACGLTVDTGAITKYPLDNIVFCHVDSGLPDAIVWVVRKEGNELSACVFKCECPGAAICLYTTFNDLHRRNRMDNRKRYLTQLVTSPKVTPDQSAVQVNSMVRQEDSYGKIRAQVVEELHRKLGKNTVTGTNGRIVGKKELEDGGEGGSGGGGGGGNGEKRVTPAQDRGDPKKEPLLSDTTKMSCGKRAIACDAQLKGGYCCCWNTLNKNNRCNSTTMLERNHPAADTVPGSNTIRKQSSSWPVSSVVKKLLTRKKTTSPGPGPEKEPEVAVRRVLPNGGYALEAKRKQAAPSVPLFWSPPPLRTGFARNMNSAILLPVLPPNWVSAHSKPRPSVHQGSNGRMRLLRRRGSTGSDNVDMVVPTWGTATLLPVYQTGSQHAPRSVMKKKAPPIPVAAVKKNVTFHAFATVQVMN